MYKSIRKIVLEPGQIIPLNFDYVFTGIFNDIKNIDILESFLDCWFDKEDFYFKDKVKILKRSLGINNKKEKAKQIDLLVELDNQIINVEMNNGISKPGVIDRNVVYASKIHGSQLKYGENDYSKIGKTIQINLNSDYNQERLRERYYLKNEEGKILTEKLEIDMLDLKLGSKMCYDKSSRYYRLARWCKVFTATSKEEFENALGDDLMSKKSKEKLVEEVEKYCSDEEAIEIYTGYSKQEMEYNTLKKINEDLKKTNTDLKDQIKKSKKDLENQLKNSIQLQDTVVQLHKNGVPDEIIMKSLNIDEKQLNEYLEN